MDVTTSQIRTIVDVLCRHLESTGRSHLTLRRELYWSVPQGPEPPDEPGNLTIGSLSEEWAALNAIADGSSDPLGWGFVWLSAVLREVGHECVG